jgi:hypothetical protein
MKLTTPKRITNDILSFCSEIDSSTRPVFVPVDHVGGVRHGYCLTDVPLFAEKNGGDVQFGWIIWECPKVALEAEFHACWKKGKNTLVDIVPKPDNEETILFLPDSQRVYEHKPVFGRQKALVDNDYTRRWLMTARKKDEIRSKHFRNDEVDSVAANDEFERWISSLPPGYPKIGRNDPCPCVSGKKYKRCCGR